MSAPSAPATGETKAKKRKFTDEQKARKREYNSNYSKTHPLTDEQKAKKRERERNYRKSHRAQNREYLKIYRKKNPERTRKAYARQELKRKKTAPWKKYKHEATRSGRRWELSEEMAEEIMRMPCHYCGYAGDPFVGIDRKDNTCGYTPENILPACTMCNWAKSTHLYEHFMAWLERVAGFVTEKKTKMNN